MKAIDCIEKLIATSLPIEKLRFCFVDESKRPFKLDAELARPNKIEDFSAISELIESPMLDMFIGVGISIQASNICAIDVDHCFNVKNDVNSADERAKDVLAQFADIAYCEFSFSGTGLRILFDADIVKDYSVNYYIKNKNTNIEYYQPTKSFRYVTLTGNVIYDNFSKIDNDVITKFLNKYMLKPKIHVTEVKQINDVDSLDILTSKIKYLYLTSHKFQDLWFSKAPGSGKDESERDYQILSLLYENITQNKDKLKTLFESSPYFKSKDFKHIKKWEQLDFRYFEYVFDQIKRRKQI